jgi:NitT/TauT family transport system substrate-binding protein
LREIVAFFDGMAIASKGLSWRLGFRPHKGDWSESCRPETDQPGARRDKSPGDLDGQDWRRLGLPILCRYHSNEDWDMKRVLSFAAALAIALTAATTAFSAPKKEFNIAWTIYVGWMPWPYAAEAGIVKKWADKYGITINVTQINDYVESVNQYTAGKFDGVTVTNMDALTIPAAGGVDTTALIIGDFSNGNDGIVLKKGKTLADIKGRKINMVELSVSHYLLARGLSTVKLKEKDIKVVNTSDADIVGAFKSPDSTAVVTWNPQLMEVKSEPGATLVFDSSKIPGEIIDLMVVNSEVLKDNPKFAKALVGIWYETLATMAMTTEAKQSMAKASGADIKGFDEQLATTKLFYDPKDAVAFATGGDLKTTTERVSKFLFDRSLLGKDAKSEGAIGVEFPDKSVFGDNGNVKFRYDATFMQDAADGKL